MFETSEGSEKRLGRFFIITQSMLKIDFCAVYCPRKGKSRDGLVPSSSRGKGKKETVSFRRPPEERGK
jgi:hypothetical protein